ncbi:MAG: hypothetical protein V3W44_10720 [Dehalococcoidales bacterium]
MASTREKLAAEAQIGPVKFWATRVTPSGNPRRIMQYTGIGVNGAVTEDLGQNARVETWTATVDESVFSKLSFVKSAAEVVTCVHPLFGAFQGRLQDIPYEAGPDDMIDITCIIVEHGEPSDIFILNTTTTAAQKQAGDAAFANLNLDELADFPTDTGLPAAGAGLTSGWDSFSSVMDAVGAADALYNDVASAYNELAEAGNLFINTIDDFADATQDMVDMVDTTYELLDTARNYVDAMADEVSTVWQNLQVTNPLSVAEIALDLMGDDSEEAIDLILSRNPTIIDLLAIPVGTELSIPVTL